MFFNKNLSSIIKTFDRVSAELSAHVEKKSREYLNLLAVKADIEDKLEDTAVETDRADRILMKVRELVA